MSSRNPYWLVRLVLLGMLVAAGFTWWFVRPPKATSAGAVFDDVQRIGRTHDVVLLSVRAMRQLASMPPDASREDILRRRARVEFILESADELAKALRSNSSQWIPLSEAELLLVDCRNNLQMALEKTPTGRIVNMTEVEESLALAPDIEGLQPQIAGLIDASSEHLLRKYDQLERRTRRAMVGAMQARGRWFGLEAADMLVVVVGMAALLGILALTQASYRLRVPPQAAERTQLDLIGRIDRRRAIELCHQRIEELLLMADEFCRAEVA